jgi:hypothetical protein
MTQTKKLQIVGQAIATIETFIRDYALDRDHSLFDRLEDLRELVKEIKK